MIYNVHAVQSSVTGTTRMTGGSARQVSATRAPIHLRDGQVIPYLKTA